MQELHRLLIEKKISISTAESCTGGMLASRLTDLSGSSAYFVGSVVAYANSVKEQLLKVGESTLAKHGAVSEQVAIAMALGAQEIFKTRLSVAVTGVAGPSGGTPEKPVGTVWVGIAGTDGRVGAHCLQLGEKPRHDIREETVRYCIRALIEIAKTNAWEYWK